MALVTSQQFQSPSILGQVQTGLVNRQAIQQEARLTREEENKQRLAQITAEQEAGQLATRQRALGVPSEVPEGETREQAEQRALAGNPEVMAEILKTVGIRTQEQKEDAAAFATSALEAKDQGEVEFLIDERVRKIQARGGDATETLKLKELPVNIRDAALRSLKTAASTEAERGRGRAVAGEKAFQPVLLTNPTTGEKILVNPVFDPATGTSRLEQADIPEGFEIPKETAKEKREAEIETAGAKKGAEVTGKRVAERRQKTVDSGFDSSKQLPSLNRALSLLDEVETGGLAAVAIRAKQTFGIEGANEAELSNRLSEAVLKQLKPTFGAAFTVEEGARLERISAGLGKSVPGNKRIIKQLIREIEKKAKDGIKAAVASEDFEAAQRIKDNMVFSLETEENDLNADEQAELAELKKRLGR